MRTKGKWLAGLNVVWDEDMHIFIRCDTEADTGFIALAGTVANQLDEQGIDGKRAIELLPEIINTLRICIHTYDTINIHEYINRKLSELRQPQPEQPADPKGSCYEEGEICEHPYQDPAEWPTNHCVDECLDCKHTDCFNGKDESDLEQRRKLDGKEQSK